MASDWRVDFALSGIGWLEKSGNIRSRVSVVGYNSHAPAPNGSSLTLTVTDLADGSTVASGTVTNTGTGGFFIANIAPSTPLVVGHMYRERWTGTIESASIAFDRDAYVSTWAGGLREPLLTTASFLFSNPWLKNFPVYATDGTIDTWDPVLRAAHAELCARLIATKAGLADLATPGRLLEPARWLSLAYIHEAHAVFPDEVARYRALFENTFAALRLSWDTDGDGDIDEENTTTAGGALNPGAPLTGGL